MPEINADNPQFDPDLTGKFCCTCPSLSPMPHRRSRRNFGIASGAIAPLPS
ncbi:hypothetical protein [Phormidium sp. CCY1219]|uniref:hypothetical protein n=1 Tax=Phormidium sp. CCY1219 TaxID=2886104 RepID=UPI002D79396C|nr:hypothetical protein [Phormidium sp. CCY1219]